MNSMVTTLIMVAMVTKNLHYDSESYFNTPITVNKSHDNSNILQEETFKNDNHVAELITIILSTYR